MAKPDPLHDPALEVLTDDDWPWVTDILAGNGCVALGKLRGCSPSVASRVIHGEYRPHVAAAVKVLALARADEMRSAIYTVAHNTAKALNRALLRADQEDDTAEVCEVADRVRRFADFLGLDKQQVEVTHTGTVTQETLVRMVNERVPRWQDRVKDAESFN